MDNVRYTCEHEWLKIEENGEAQVGITDYAQGCLGDVVFVNLPKVGTKIKQGEKFGEIESVKAVSDLFSPVSGEVVAVNSELDTQPELVNRSPFQRGWMLRIRLDNPSEISALMDDGEYDLFVKEVKH